MNYKNGHYLDYEYKSYILKEKKDLIDLQKNVSKALFTGQDVYDFRSGELVMEYEMAKGLDMIYMNDEEYIEATKINHAGYERKKRLSKRIEKYLKSGECLFVTLTFTDEVLEKTSADTRRQYVRKFLKENSDRYVANIDFGEKNGREHYHAVIQCDKLNLDSWRNKCGNLKVEKIRVDEKAPERIGKYISKLTNHAIKETTRRNALIYSVDK